jgi:hypothetical protein
MELEEQLRCVELLVLTWSEPMDFYFLDEVQLAKDRQHPLMFTKMEGRHLRAWYGPLPSEWAHREVIPETSLLFSVEERGDSYSAYDDGEPFNYIDQFVSRILKDADPDRVVRGCEVWNPCYF